MFEALMGIAVYKILQINQMVKLKFSTTLINIKDKNLVQLKLFCKRVDILHSCGGVVIG